MTTIKLKISKFPAPIVVVIINNLGRVLLLLFVSVFQFVMLEIEPRALVHGRQALYFRDTSPGWDLDLDSVCTCMCTCI